MAITAVHACMPSLDSLPTGTADSFKALSIRMCAIVCLLQHLLFMFCLLMQPSVDGKDPVDEALYRQVWGLQSAFQDPVKQVDPENWAKTLASIQSVLSKLQQEPIGVASTTTAVSQGACHYIVCLRLWQRLIQLCMRTADVCSCSGQKVLLQIIQT